MVPRSENEKYFQDPITKIRTKFPSLNEPHSKYLSIIIPAYKEVERCKNKDIFSSYFNKNFYLFSTRYD
jgi:hypothetical protein